MSYNLLQKLITGCDEEYINEISIDSFDRIGYHELLTHDIDIETLRIIITRIITETNRIHRDLLIADYDSAPTYSCMADIIHIVFDDDDIETPPCNSDSEYYCIDCAHDIAYLTDYDKDSKFHRINKLVYEVISSVVYNVTYIPT